MPLTSDEKISKIYDAMMGDPEKGISGMFAQHHQVMEDLYGVGAGGLPIDGKKNFLLKRISKLEENQKKVWWVVIGICSAFTAAKVGINTFIENIFNKP
jgi:hypothetical protein